MNPQQDFLLEETEEQLQLLANIRRLLTSDEEINCKMAIEIMKGGGVPPQLVEDLIIYSKTLSNSAIRAAIRKLLEKQALFEWNTIIQDTTAFVNIETTKEKDIRAKMARMVQKVGWQELATLGYLLFQRFEKGLSFILSYPQNNPYRIKAMEMITHDGYLDFHKGVGYTNRKDGSLGWSTVVKTGIAFPDDHPQAASLTSINFHNCKLTSVSPKVKVFENLEELDLSHNQLKSLPPAMAHLPKLRKLDLSNNQITTFPTVLLKMTSLEELDLRGNISNRGNNIENFIPEEFFKALPNCKVKIY
ncbi:leucine-rich repeat domain-containing protein [Cytophagaceae bacterium DM2B3-1]|uniref:Leucine-rich repeat domain-containing protein n=1 Tax=Xanthocytophaga flava TaxID=3048013 RepID=A0ABT7CM36_9BACT|nr:leucine-rich repeat domain-containing protein [Xanthocytophaga flavus]MDJ1494755.1 leucine-rich repeat domain-containing protein [Xanthocytophaga flavus]